jgi:hypothetical protein
MSEHEAAVSPVEATQSQEVPEAPKSRPGPKKARPRKPRGQPVKATRKKPAKSTSKRAAKSKAAKPAKRAAKGKSAAKGSGPSGSAKKASGKRGAPGRKRSGKPPGHWSKTHAQLVIHAHPSLVAKLDRSLARIGKRLKLENPTRGSVVRGLVEAAVK